MLGDVVDPRVHEISQEVREVCAVGFVEDDALRISHPATEDGQGSGLEVVEEEIRDQDAVVGGRGHGEEVALSPLDFLGEMLGFWGEVVSCDRRVWKFLRKLMAERSVAGADFCDVVDVGKFSDGLQDPAFVAHEAVDPSKVAATAHRIWM